MSKTENAFDPILLRQEFIFAGKVGFVSLAIYILFNWLNLGIYSLVIQGLVALTVVGAVTQAYWKGATFLSVYLQGERRKVFQIILSIVPPLILLIILLVDVKNLDFQAYRSELDWYSFLPFFIYGYFSWRLADEAHKEHPFRVFVFSSAVIFVLLFIASKGHPLYVWSEETELSKDELKAFVEYGGYAIEYFLYVVTSSLVMLARIKTAKQY